jgi:hypothetical protein
VAHLDAAVEHRDGHVARAGRARPRGRHLDVAQVPLGAEVRIVGGDRVGRDAVVRLGVEHVGGAFECRDRATHRLALVELEQLRVADRQRSLDRRVHAVAQGGAVARVSRRAEADDDLAGDVIGSGGGCRKRRCACHARERDGDRDESVRTPDLPGPRVEQDPVWLSSPS